MNNEEKILAILTQMQADVSGISDRMERLESGQAALEGRMERINGDLKFTNLGLRNLEHKQSAFEGRMGRLEEALSKAQGDITSIKARLDYDVDKRLTALVEGQEAIERRLDTLDEVKTLAESTADKVDVIHAVVAQHSADITELKVVK